MRIGILTFHRSLNVGAALQAWALQSYLRGIGHDAYIIDYGRIGCPPRFALQRASLRNLVGESFRFVNSLWCEDSRRRKYDRFIKDNMLLIPVKSKTMLSSLDLDCFICGSDLVWHQERNGCDLSYFLDFSSDKKLKVAYAPSFGGTLSSFKKQPEICSCLRRFDWISVRETFSKKMLYELIGYDAPIVCDPTLLNDVSVYRRVARSVGGLPQRYVLLYVICGHAWASKIASKISDVMACPVIFYLGGNTAKWISAKQRGALLNIGPSEFLSLVAHSQAVVTNSFHGLVFATLFNKPPYVAINNAELDARMTDFATILGIGKHVLSTPEEFAFQNDVDWISVGHKLCAMRRSGIDFLNEVVGSPMSTRHNSCSK